jgi:hypothetical protein
MDFCNFLTPTNSQGVDFSFSNFRYSTQCLLQIEDRPTRTKVNFHGGLVKRESIKIIIIKGIAHHCVRLLKAVNSIKHTLAQDFEE